MAEPEIRERQRVKCPELNDPLRFPPFADVGRAFVGQQPCRNLDYHLVAIPDADDPVVRHRADNIRMKPPVIEDRPYLVEPSLGDDHEHALLALREHDLVGGHAGLAPGNPRDVDL